MKAIASLFFLLACMVSAMFIAGEKVPLERLMMNVKAHFADYPNQAEAHYLLGRLESLAFSGEADSVQVLGPSDTHKLPAVRGFSWGQENDKTRVSETTLSPSGRELFFSSIGHYRQAITFDANNALYHFSLGWMADQGQQRVSQLSAPPADITGDGKIRTWRMLAIREYQAARDLSVMPARQGPGPALAEQSRRALIADLRDEIQDREKKVQPQSDRAFIADAKRQIAANQTDIDHYDHLPITVTPLIFSTRPQAQFADLLSPSLVSFDLSGFGEDRKWPWLQPDTAILVWDPTNESHIRSGRQLFGSVTWWMFWNNGFEPLAALDDNADGQLTGKELDGIAVWQDKNSNGISDPGEVIPAKQFGIVALTVHPEGHVDGVLAARNGVITRENPFTLYDWEPTSFAPPTLSLHAYSPQPLSLSAPQTPHPGVR